MGIIIAGRGRGGALKKDKEICFFGLLGGINCLVAHGNG